MLSGNQMEYLQKQLLSVIRLLKIITVSLAAWLVFWILVSVFSLYRTIVDLILRFKVGKTYGGLFDKTDAVFLVPDSSKLFETGVFYIKTEQKTDLLKIYRQLFKEKVFDQPDLYPKLTSSKHEYGGYAYYMKYGCTINDVLYPLELPNNIKFTEEYLKKVTGDISNQEHPKNKSMLWDIHISSVPIEEKYKDGCYCYPIIMRFHHSIADGTSLVLLFLKLFASEESINYAQEIFNKKKNIHKRKSSLMSKILNSSIFWLNVIFITFGKTILESNQTIDHSNSLQSPSYSGEKIAAWATEENPECIALIKKIKNGTKLKFSMILNTAIAASITKYFERNLYDLPPYVIACTAILLGIPSVNISEAVSLGNNTTFVGFQLPTITKYKTLLDALNNISETMNKQISYAQAFVIRKTIYTYLGGFPLPLMSRVLRTMKSTIVISNVPGSSQFKMLNRCTLENVIPLGPNFGNGVTFSLYSYDDRFQIGVLVDKTLIQKQEEVQKLADYILHSIKLLNTEFESSNYTSSSTLKDLKVGV